MEYTNTSLQRVFKVVFHSAAVSYLMQRSNDFASLLVDDLWPPVRVKSCQVFGQPVVFSHPERMEDRQGQDLVYPAVTCRETLDPLWPGILEARGWLDRDEGQVRQALIRVFTIDSQETFRAREVSEDFLEVFRMAVDGWCVYEGRDWIHLLSNVLCVSLAV